MGAMKEPHRLAIVGGQRKRRATEKMAMSAGVPTTVYAAVERVLDEHSAWIARPSPEVTKAVAIAAGIAWSLRTDEIRRGEEVGWVIEREDSEPSRPMYFTGKNWDYDNLKAVRFAREQDAQTMARYMFPGEPHRIADHMWCP